MSTEKLADIPPIPPRQVRVPPGPLGLTMGNKPGSGGAVVVAVSPVNASVVQVSPGDQITAIDGEDVSQLNSYEVTTILNKKRDFERVLSLLYSPQIQSASDSTPTKIVRHRTVRPSTPSLPSSAVSEILQLARLECKIPLNNDDIDAVVGGSKPPDHDKYVNAKVNEFLLEVVDHTLDLAYHELSRYAALPYDVARALRVFAENGFANASDGPKFVIDCSSDDDLDDDWEDRVDVDDEDEQEDVSVTVSMIQVDDYEYVSWESDDEAFIGEDKYQQDTSSAYSTTNIHL